MQQSTPASSRSASRAPRGNAPRQRHTFWWYLKWFFISIQLVLFCAIVATASILYGVYQRLDKLTPDVRRITVHNKAEPTVVYAADGSKLAEFKGEQRDWIQLEEMKREVSRSGKTTKELGWLPLATIAIEDWRFYSHPGMDPIRIVKAAIVNFKSGSVEQGGSTITEQLAKNIYLSRTRTISRRLQTALLALKLERSFSKDEILELYLNEIYYGNNAYGCEAASHRYFGKSAGKLSIAEAALLAGLPQSPTRLDPFEHFKRAKDRQRIILQAMLRLKKINYSQYLQAVKDTSIQGKIAASLARFREERNDKTRWRSPYFVSYVKSYLQKQYNWSDEFLSKSGLKIYTTLDPKIQAVAERVMNGRIAYLDNNGKLQGALVCIDPWSGRVLAMYGGRDYYNTKLNGQFNRAVQAKRQPGSTFKPYVYATAMEMGYTPDSIVKDEPLMVWGHKIRNYDFKNRGAMTLRSAIGMSNNIAATKTLMKVKIENVVEKAHLMGITSSLRPVPTLALGTSEISLLENTSAFGVFATRGLRAEQTPIIRVDNYAGETLVDQPTPVSAARVLSTDASNRMWDMLRYVVTNGTGRAAALDNAEAIGKTGTTSSNKDVWFMGATKQLACGVWMGYDRPLELYGSSGGKWCAPAWKRFMEEATTIWKERNKVEKLVESRRVTNQRKAINAQNKQYVQVRICDISGLLATRSCPGTHVEEFSASGGAPTQYCDIHAPKNPPKAQVPDQTDSAQDAGIDPDTALPPAVPDENIPARRDNGDNADNADNADTAQPPPGDGRDSAEVVPRADESARRAPDAEYSPTSYRSEDDNYVVATVCADTGELARANCPVTMQSTFLKGEQPKRKCSRHR